MGSYKAENVWDEDYKSDSERGEEHKQRCSGAQILDPADNRMLFGRNVVTQFLKSRIKCLDGENGADYQNEYLEFSLSDSQKIGSSQDNGATNRKHVKAPLLPPEKHDCPPRWRDVLKLFLEGHAHSIPREINAFTYCCKFGLSISRGILET